MDFRNTTPLDSARLRAMFEQWTQPYAHDGLVVRVRPSRGADFSGACYYLTSRIFINIGGHNRYPYRLATNVARACGNRTHWWRQSYRIVLADGYQLALFIYLHELFHYLVKAAGRCTRRKEAMCDRFATRVLVDGYSCALLDSSGFPVARESWDFQNLERFVAAAPRQTPLHAPRPPIPVRIVGV